MPNDTPSRPPSEEDAMSKGFQNESARMGQPVEQPMAKP